MDRTGKLRKLSIVRRKALDQAVADTNRIRQSHQDEQQKLSYLRDVRTDYHERSPVRVGALTQVPVINRHQAFGDRLDLAIGEQSDRCAQIDSEVARREQITRDRHRHLETLEKLIERQQRALARRHQQIEQKTLDDHTTIRHHKSGESKS